LAIFRQAAPSGRDEKYSIILGIHRGPVELDGITFKYFFMIHQEDLESPRISQPNLQTILRLALGFLIIWRGFTFIYNTAALQVLIERTDLGIFSDNAHVLAFIISYLSLLCGFFIFVGLFSRIAALIMIPVLIVAVFFVYFKDMEYNRAEFIISLVALLLLIYTAIKGSGRFSADEYFSRGELMDHR